MKYKHNIDNIIDNAKRVSLESEEKLVMRTLIEEHMEKVSLVLPNMGSIPRRVSALELLSKLGRSSMLIPSLFLVLIAGGGTLTLASQRSLPGDVLYPMKTLSEKMDLALAFTSQSRAKVSAIQAVRRLEEAEVLYAEDRLDENTKIALAASFSQESSVAIEHMEVLKAEREESGLKILAEFKGNLRAHKDILQNIVGMRDDSRSFRLPEAVQAVIATLDIPDNSVVIAGDDTNDAAKVAKSEAEQQIKDTNKYISANMSREEKVKIVQALSAAEESFKNGNQAIESNSYKDAITLFKQASKQSIEVKALAQSYNSVKKYISRPSALLKKKSADITVTAASTASTSIATTTTATSTASTTNPTATSFESGLGTSSNIASTSDADSGGSINTNINTDLKVSP